jgi:D-alanine-D-alanine ligase
MKKLRIAVLANLKKNAPRWDEMSPDQWDDLDSEKTVAHLVDAVQAGGHDSAFFEGNLSLVAALEKYQPDICFNICEGHFGDSREAQVPALLEMLRIPYTGSRVLTLSLALDKPMTKRILAWHDLPTPAFQTFERIDETLHDDLQFPLFAKPSREGTGMGVSSRSVINNEAELREQIAYIIKKYHQPALVERFIAGREVTVGLVGNLIGPVARRMPDPVTAPRIQAGLRFFPALEVDLKPFLESDAVYSNRLKVDMAEQLTYLCPAPLENDTIDELNWLAAACFRVVGALDVSRIDFRLDENDNNKPYILEINPLPGLSPGISDIVIEAAADGIDHTQLVNMILDTALQRYGLR